MVRILVMFRFNSSLATLKIRSAKATMTSHEELIGELVYDAYNIVVYNKVL